MLAPWSEYEHHEPDVLARMVGALSQWAAFAQRLDLPPTARPRPGGTLHVALTREDEHRLADRVERLSALGPEADLRVLDAEACREREPALNDRVCAGVLLPCEASIDNRELLRVLGERADEGGVERADDWIDPLGTRTPSDVVVWATGAFDPAPRLAVRHVQGISVRVRAPGVVRHVVRAEIDRRTCYLVPRDSGEIVIGASSADIGPDVSTIRSAYRDRANECRGRRPGAPERRRDGASRRAWSAASRHLGHITPLRPARRGEACSA